MTEPVKNKDVCPVCHSPVDVDGLCKCSEITDEQEAELLAMIDKEAVETERKQQEESEAAQLFVRAEFLEALCEANGGDGDAATGGHRHQNDATSSEVRLPGWEDPLQVLTVWSDST